MRLTDLPPVGSLEWILALTGLGFSALDCVQAARQLSRPQQRSLSARGCGNDECGGAITGGHYNPTFKTTGTPGSQQQAASCLAELALVAKNRDKIANADGIEPRGRALQLRQSLAVGLGFQIM